MRGERDGYEIYSRSPASIKQRMLVTVCGMQLFCYQGAQNIIIFDNMKGSSGIMGVEYKGRKKWS